MTPDINMPCVFIKWTASHATTVKILTLSSPHLVPSPAAPPLQIGCVALVCAALLPKLGQSLLVYNLLFLNFSLFTGFLVRKSTITWAFRWITYLSPMR